MAAGPDAVTIAQLELAIYRSTPADDPAAVAEHVDAAVQIARATRRVLIQELERQAAGGRPAA